MGLYNTRAIVLRSIKLSETDKLVTFLTEKYGKIKCAAKSARKIKSKFGAALEPMSYIQLIYFGKEHQDIFRLNHCDIIQSFQSVREDLQKVYTAIYLNDLVDSLVPDGEKGIEIFHFLLQVLNEIETENHIETLCRFFEIRLMSMTGYKPRLDYCIVCRNPPEGDKVGFSFIRSSVICIDCVPKMQMDVQIHTGALNYVRKLLNIDLKQSKRLIIPKFLEKEIEMITHRSIVSHLGRELRSYPFIQKMAAFASF